MKKTFNQLLILFILAILFSSKTQAQIITTVAGNGIAGYSGDGLPATDEELYKPCGLFKDGAGNIYIADCYNNLVRKINTSGIISTVAGNGSSGFSGDGGQATNAKLQEPVALFMDPSGNLYIADYLNHCVRKVNSSGIISTVAGIGGSSGFSGDGTPATGALLNGPEGVFMDASGNLYISDAFNQRIRKVSASGIISTFAGNGTPGFSSDGIPATNSELNYPFGVVGDASGNIYIADQVSNRIRKVNTSGIISTIAGTGATGYFGDGGAATSAQLNYPCFLYLEAAGNNLYFSDRHNHVVRKINSSGIISTIAGTGTPGYTGDGAAATLATLNWPTGLMVDNAGNILFSDYNNNVIRMVGSPNDPPTFNMGHNQTLLVCENSGLVSINSYLPISDSDAGQTETWVLHSAPLHGTVIGLPYSVTSPGSTAAITPTGVSYHPTSGYSGTDSFKVWVNDGTSIDSTTIHVTVQSFFAGHITPDPVNICPSNTATLSADTAGGTWSSSNTAIATVSGGVVTGVSAGFVAISYTITNSCGTTSSATEVAVGNKVISTFAGTGVAGYTGDGGAATAAKFNNTHGISVDPATGMIYIVDDFNSAVRKVDPTTGIVTAVAGNGTAGYTGEGSATTHEMNQPFEVLADGSGNIYITDGSNNRVRKVNSSGIISTIAGTGTAGSLGDGGQATDAQLNVPAGIVFDAAGNMFIGDISNNKIRKIDPSGIITTYAGTGTLGFGGDGGQATAALLSHPNYLKMDPNGNLLIVDNGNHRVRKIDAAGIITTIVGTGVNANTGDGGQATAAALSYPGGLGFDKAGNLYIASDGGNSVRMVNTSGIITKVVGSGSTGYTGDGGSPSTATLHTVVDVTFDANDNMFIADQQNSVIRKVSVVAPVVLPVVGPNVLCVGATITLTDATTPGTWSSSNPGVAVVGATTGIVTGVAGGVTIITYSVVYACGTMYSTQSVTVNALPAPISPLSATICIGSAVTFTDATSGGTWSLTTTNATNVGGIVTGAFVGLDTVVYTVSGCNATAPVTVVAAPAAISPGTGTVCTGATISFTDATGGGIWSMTNTHASIVGGTVTGVSAGLDTVLYSVGTCVSKAYVTVNTSPAAISPASATICVGSTTTLTDATPGGTWSAQNGNATVVGGLVTGIAAGTDIISYTLGSCYATSNITIVTAPAALSPVSASVCVGNTVTFTDATSGGTWTMRHANATIAGGIVTGVAAGLDTVVYTVGTCFVTAPVTVNNMPAAINPLTAVTVCVGSTTNLTDATPGGIWSSGSPSIATVSGTGVVTGVAPGTATISYTSGLGCAVTKVVTVVAAPAGISPASSSVCIGNTVTLTDATPGGVWSANNANATVAGGIVTGVSAGVDTINYTIGTCSVSATVTVNALPAAITPAGAVSMCVGASATLADATPGGTWSSGAPGTATVTGGGVVTGVAAGSVTISYTNSSGCSATKVVTIDVTPGALSPSSSLICVGNTVTLTDGVGGGTWSTTAPTIATVAGGVVTGVAIGNATINYTIGTCTASATVTVAVAPTAGTITGPSTVCVGNTITLSDPTPGGVWSSTITSVATVSGAGVVLGVGGGTTTISYTVSNACGSAAATATVTAVPAGVSPITGPSTVCAGTFGTLADATTGGTWSASNAHATISGAGLLTGVSVGTDTITYSITNVCGTSSATKIITVGPYLTAGAITGAGSVCVGANITLSDLAPGGVWGATNGNATVAGGLVTGITSGVDTINYTVTSSCGSAVATHAVTVNPLPNAGTITGPAAICIGSLIIYTDAISGGVWGITNSHATISGSGVVTPVSVGTDTITYTVTNSCGTASTSYVITVGPFLTAGSITGLSTVCTSSTITLTDAAPGGIWSASNSHASIGGTGIVTGMTAGIDTISYTVTSSCGVAIATTVITVNPTPVAGTISGPSTVCMGSPATYTDAAPGGVWSISNAHATISGTGLVTPVSAGTDTISYTVTNVCGTAIATQVITIGGVVTAGTITGAGIICIGTPVTLIDATPGGVWSASNGHATVAGGVVTGVTAGIDTISYTVTSSCGTAVATKIVTVSALPVAGVITGPSAMCTGTFTLYSDASPGGVWSLSNTRATVSGTGLVTAITVGTDTLSYTVTNVCGVASAIKVITISTSAGAGTITGPSAVCIGSLITLTDGTPGGVWGTINSHAFAGLTGIVTGLSAGVDTITYSVTSSCGTVVATHVVTVSATTATGTITGPSAVCFGSTITLSDAVAGGTWSSSNANATISPLGIVNGITPGLDTIIYTVTGVCGTASTSVVISIDNTPVAGTITGPSTECVGASILLTDPAPGGTWSAVNTNATVSGTGMVTGVSAGTDLISYTVTNACGSVAATMMVTINPLPDAGTITGADSVCIGSSITLSDASPGGIWSAGNANATVSGIGVVFGITSGTDPISYTVINSCGTASSVLIVTISSLATAGTISGISSVCVGSGITLTDGVPGGTWLASNGHALVTGPGIINGVSVGVDTILYVVTTSCGTSTAFKVISVNPVPVVSAISGPTSQCTGTTISLTDVTPGGIWTSSMPSVATIGLTSGIATGISVGTTTLTYTVTNSFGCPGSVTSLDTVNLMPVTPAITGAADVCVGGNVTLGDALAGGTWTSSTPSVATVIAGTGVVTGVSAGTVTISYIVVNSCGTSSVTRLETVNPLPVIAPVTGTASECPGSATTLSDATPGGVWSSSNIAIAAVGTSTGVVTGITSGTVLINYTVTNSFGCSNTVSITNTVNVAPVVAAITGSANVCVGASSALADATPTGTWTSSNPSVATVSGSGLVSGVAAGIVTITYSVAGTGCTGIATISDTVNSIPLPAPITGGTNVCVGAALTLADAIAGGTWSSSNISVATISGSGVVTGISAGTSEIYYSISNSCGSVTDSISMSVQVFPSAGTITGATGVCQGSAVTLADVAGGGVWSASNARATVGSTTGIVTGVTAGLDTIKYTVTNSCGSATASHPISINAAPYPGVISGYTSVCAGMSIALTESVTGGTWSSSNSSVATVSAGTVAGLAIGTVTISYSVTNGCGTRSATHAVSVVSPEVCHTMTGTIKGSEDEISVFPNPASTILNISAPVVVNITMLSIDGKVVIDQKSVTKVDISNLANGMYFVNIFDENGQLLKTMKLAKMD